MATDLHELAARFRRRAWLIGIDLSERRSTDFQQEETMVTKIFMNLPAD
jgi:hypothetical protein